MPIGLAKKGEKKAQIPKVIKHSHVPLQYQSKAQQIPSLEIL